MYCDWPVLGRCCFCLPLRRGILTFGYINLLFTAFMVGVYSYAVHNDFGMLPMYHGASSRIPESGCVAIYCLELIFTALLLYGAHKKLTAYIKAYYYFAITTTVASVLLQILDVAAASATLRHAEMAIQIVTLMLAAVCIQVYLIILIRSLLKKMETSGPHVYENQLQQIVYDGKVEANGVYDPTVLPVDV